MSPPLHWRDDEAFVEWMISMQYAYRDGEKIKHYFDRDGIVAGTILYMWEAWRAGKKV